ncbi:Dps family protein [Gloeobacter kilaueensis]|uniref:Ferritin Dps family protein n=1 Tax=Gloeobacter kilaueensis (strain ATCC BAA-2537 / CCAP 1431/1 / ULC 316 / JS1) TaxID=1183438 RepID=U5QHV7_GLOK1|nr:DNA starvation/stationary phase protection protein [Gloeobacter kilaueensis]AGY57209.1 ferritin Dps family protein [Gloeobacter kilaueensis JS1]
MRTEDKSTQKNTDGLAQPILHQKGIEIQPFGTLIELPIGLDAKVRADSCESLNQLLADSVILYYLYKKHHWLVRGETFYQLHLLLDKHADEQLELVDMIAERIQKLGGIAISDPRHVAEVTRISRPPNGAEEVPAMLSRLLEAHQIVIEDARKGAELTDENGDSSTNDLLTSEVLPTNETQIWYIASHLVDTPLVRS